MSCDCENSCGPCREELPYPIVSEESVPSLISNLAYALYGNVTKSVVNGSIIWNTPCDPNLSAQITGLPRNPGEGLLCYFLRCFNLIVSGSFLVQDGSISPSKLTTGHPTWDAAGNLTILGNLALTGTANIANITGNAATATLAASATNLAGGTGGALPYQSAAGVTSFLSPGTSGYVLTSGGTGAPAWKQATAAGTANTVVLRDGSGRITGSEFLGNASTATALQAARTITLTGDVTGSATDNSGNISINTALAIPTTGITASAVVSFNPTIAAKSGGSLTGSSNVATITFGSAHGNSVGDCVTIFAGGSIPSNCVGTFIITSVTSLSLSFAIVGSVSGTVSSVTIYPYQVFYNPMGILVGPVTAGGSGKYLVQGSSITSNSIFMMNAGRQGSLPGIIGLYSRPTAGSVTVLAMATNNTAFDYDTTHIVIF